VPRGLLRPQSRLRMTGTHAAIEEAMRVLRGDAAPSWVIDRIRRKARERREDISVVEMTVTADSRLLNRTLPSSGIADLYGVAVIGIHRPDRLLGEKDRFTEAGDMRIAEGDVLLVMGMSEELQAFAGGDSLLTLEGKRELPRRSKSILAAGIMGASVGAASIGLLPIAISPTLPAMRPPPRSVRPSPSPSRASWACQPSRWCWPCCLAAICATPRRSPIRPTC
jgi:hypothetical protein